MHLLTIFEIIILTHTIVLKSFVQQTCIEEVASTGVLSSLSLTNLGNRNEMPCNQRSRKFSSQATFFDKQ